MFYFTFSLVINAWVSLQSFPGSAWNWPHLLQLHSCPCCLVPQSLRMSKAWFRAAGEKNLIEQQTEAVCPWVYKDRSLLICTLQVTFITLKSGKLILVWLLPRLPTCSVWVNFEALYNRLVHMQRMNIVLSSNSFSYLKCHLLESP